MDTAASTAGTTTVEATVGATLGSATGGEPWSPEGVPEDVLEESEMAPGLVPEEAPVEGAMVVARLVAPPPSHGARAPFSPAPCTTATTGAATGAGLEVVLRHLTPYALDDIPLGEAVRPPYAGVGQAPCTMAMKLKTKNGGASSLPLRLPLVVRGARGGHHEVDVHHADEAENQERWQEPKS
jgi:hypothetical protein